MVTPYDLVNGRQERNCVIPLFWQHGEDFNVLREELEAMHDSGIGAFIAEARPFDGYLTDKWWKTLDFLMAEARRLGMEVWVFDDGHFPSGFAGGLVQEKRPDLMRQMLRCSFGSQPVLEDDETVLARIAFCMDDVQKLPIADSARVLADKETINDGELLATLILTRHGGEGHTAPYINLLDEKAVDFYIETIYRSHFEHLQQYAGNTFQGFFSDEPRFGNHPSYDTFMGMPDVTQPWEATMPDELSQVLGRPSLTELPFLWTNAADHKHLDIRQAFMDVVSRRFGILFSRKIGEWCEARNLKHIGHIVEDNGAHCRIGYGPGQYFRSQQGQHWAGIDTVLLQQGPERTEGFTKTVFGSYNNRFYHFGLAKLASSCATMCPEMDGSFVEIFGAYGWHTGIAMQKWLVDHFASRGINHFSPHAFSPAAFPDKDCPPHFYARGQNPQWKLFPQMVAYMQRFGNLLAEGCNVTPVAVLYHAENEWTGEPCEPFESVVAQLAVSQIDCDVVDLDHLATASVNDGKFTIGKGEYSLLFVPACDYASPKLFPQLETLCERGCAVVFVQAFPKNLPEKLAKRCLVYDPEKLAEAVGTLAAADFRCERHPKNLHVMHWRNTEGDAYFCLNESLKDRASCAFSTPIERQAYFYEPALNKLWKAGEPRLAMDLAPGQMMIVWYPVEPLQAEVPEWTLHLYEPANEKVFKAAPEWTVEICPVGGNWQKIGTYEVGTVLDDLPEFTAFSGEIRFTTQFDCCKSEGETEMLGRLTNFTGVGEWRLNGKLLPPIWAQPYETDLGTICRDGRNTLEVIQYTTPHRKFPDSPFDREYKPEVIQVPEFILCL